MDVPKEVKRFHVAVRGGVQGLVLKCSDASSRHIRQGSVGRQANSRVEFDYAAQAVIFVPGESKPLPSTSRP